MVAPKLLLLLLVFSLGLAGIRADSGLVDEGVDPGVPEDPSPLRRELEKLQSKIASLGQFDAVFIRSDPVYWIH